LRLAGKVANVRREKGFNAERRRKTKAGEDRGVEGIDPQEGTAIANGEDPEKLVDEASPGILHRFAATDLMDSRVEQVLLALKRVRVSTRTIVAFDHQRLLTCLREEGGRREAAHATSDDDDVVCLLPGFSADAHEFPGITL
jgi:hypothetical protein